MTTTTQAPEQGATFAEFEAFANDDIKATVEAVDAGVQTVVTNAQEIQTVKSPAEAEAVARLLADLVRMQRSNEKLRKDTVKPFNDGVKAINARFGETSKPLDEAIAVLKPKLLAWEAELEAKRQAEQARLDAEAAERQRQIDEDRRAAEQAAREQAQAAAAQARRVAEAAQAEEAERQRKIREDADDVARRAASANDQQLAFAAERDDKFGGAARNETAARKHQAAQQADADAARVAAENAAAAEEAQCNAPVEFVASAVVVPSAPAGNASGVGTKKVWDFEVVDRAAIPARFLIVNEKALRAEMRELVAGITTDEEIAAVRTAIPGVVIAKKPQLSVAS